MEINDVQTLAELLKGRGSISGAQRVSEYIISSYTVTVFTLEERVDFLSGLLSFTNMTDPEYRQCLDWLLRRGWVAIIKTSDDAKPMKIISGL